MRLLVGLGNPGGEFDQTRHNVGFLVLDKVVEAFLIGVQDKDFKFQKKFSSEIITDKDYVFAKPQTYMNSSGIAVSRLSSFYKISPSKIFIIHDDLDIRLGSYKVTKGVGPRVHYGVNSVEEKLGTKEFWRVRVGVDNRLSDNRIEGEVYVLQTFNEEERVVLEKVIEEIVKDLIDIFTKDE